MLLDFFMLLSYVSYYIYIYIYQTLLSKATYSAFRLYICIVSMCVPWESNPQPLRCKRNALTTEPQEHCVNYINTSVFH